MSLCTAWHIHSPLREKNATASLIVESLLVIVKYSMSVTLREPLVTLISCPSNLENHGKCKYKYVKMLSLPLGWWPHRP